MLFTGLPGITSIYRDDTQRVTRVPGPDEDTYLIFSSSGQLSRVISIKGDLVTDEYLDYVVDSTGSSILSDVRKYIKDIQAADIQNLIAHGTFDPVTQSAWTIPYNAPENPVKPAAPTGFAVAMRTANQPEFQWNLITDPTVVGVLIYFGSADPVHPGWKVWSYVVPVPTTSFFEPYTLDKGIYKFAIAALNSDGAESELAIFNTPVEVL